MNMTRAYLMAACWLQLLLVTVYCGTYRLQVQPPPDATDAAIEGPNRQKRQTFGDYGGTDYNQGGGCGRNRNNGNNGDAGNNNNLAGERIRNGNRNGNSNSNGRNGNRNNNNNNMRNRRFNSTGEFNGDRFRRMNGTFGGAFKGSRGFAAADANKKMMAPILPAPGSEAENVPSFSLTGTLPSLPGGPGGPSPQALKPVVPIASSDSV